MPPNNTRKATVPVAKKTPSATPEGFEAVRDWIARNPMRVWRERYRVPRVHVSVVLQCTDKTIQNWENGSGQPTHSHLLLLFGSPGATEMQDRWTQWYTDRPNQENVRV